MGKTTPTLLDTAERRAFVLNLRKSGATYRRIADMTLNQFGRLKLPKGWDARYAYKDVMRELERLRIEIGEDTAEIRQMELERLDELFVSEYTKAKQGIGASVDRCLRIMERRSRLLGLDAPSRVEFKDWRREAEDAGLSPGDLFNHLVGEIVRQSKNGSGSISGGD
jgi:hypothetical protein